MKIKELLTEGPWDFAKGLWKTGSLTGAKATNQQAQATKEIKPFIDSIINSWNRYVGLTNKNTAADAVTWAATNFKSDVSPVAKPADDTPEEINRFLTDVAKLYKAGDLKSTAGTGTKYKSRQSAVTPITPQASATSSAPSMAGKYGKSAASTQPQDYQSPMGVTVKASSDRGHVLTYKNNNYWPNNRGEWAIDGKDNSPATPQLQAEMDKVAGFA
jgi:hypothetical protein